MARLLQRKAIDDGIIGPEEHFGTPKRTEVSRGK
jgi:hypothetical protein